VLLFHPVHFAGFPPTKTAPIIVSSIRYDEELNCWFFASSTVFVLFSNHRICALCTMLSSFCHRVSKSKGIKA